MTKSEMLEKIHEVRPDHLFSDALMSFDMRYSKDVIEKWYDGVVNHGMDYRDFGGVLYLIDSDYNRHYLVRCSKCK